MRNVTAFSTNSTKWTASTKTKGGTGLGLAIAKEIIGMHGGRIWVESIVGRGSTFRLELPVRALSSGAAG